MKRVGIFTRIDNHNGKLVHLVPSDLIDKLHRKVKIRIIPFTIDDSFDDISEDLLACDGVILPGGDDIYPLEMDVVKYLHAKDIPTLGICLGMQTIACATGGIMGSLPNLNHKSPKEYVHYVNIAKDSKLFLILNKEKILVNSRHKDYISSSKLDICAISDDGIIEAVEDPKKRFFLGVQWHPENLKDEDTMKLFNYFISTL